MVTWVTWRNERREVSYAVGRKKNRGRWSHLGLLELHREPSDNGDRGRVDLPLLLVSPRSDEGPSGSGVDSHSLEMVVVLLKSGSHRLRVSVACVLVRRRRSKVVEEAVHGRADEIVSVGSLRREVDGQR